MARCSFCHQEMTEAAGCMANTAVAFFDGDELSSIPHDGPGPCGDCGVRPGQPHHPGCDQEECPRCHGQIISCDCEIV